MDCKEENWIFPSCSIAESQKPWLETEGQSAWGGRPGFGLGRLPSIHRDLLTEVGYLLYRCTGRCTYIYCRTMGYQGARVEGYTPTPGCRMWLFVAPG